MNLQAILFDLDDTLLWDERSVREAFEATCTEASLQYPTLIKPDELEDSVRKEARSLYESYETFPFTKMIGINPFEALWGNFTEGDQPEFRILQELAPTYRAQSWTRGLSNLGIDDSALGERLGEMFPAERRKRAFVYEETFHLLDALKGTYTLLLLTNGSPDLQMEKISGVPQLASYFDHIVISGSFGAGKPDITIFQHAMDLLGIVPTQGLMIGDKLTTDILGSNRVGMKNVWINHHIIRNDDIIPCYEINQLNEVLPLIQSISND